MGKKISIMIPCFNEVENVIPISKAVVDVMEKELPEHDYEILFIDNASTDGTRDKIRQVCATNKKIKAIFNVTNFGQFNSPFHGLCETTGDCTISLCADFQDPVELIPVFVKEWEKGHKIVSGVKTSSKENPIVYFARSVYYRLIHNMSSVKMIEHFTGFGLYDKTFIALLRELDDPIPFIRGIVAEYGDGFNMIEVEYEQPKRRAGKTHNNFYTLYDAAMLSFTSYTKVGLRLATFFGFFAGISGHLCRNSWYSCYYCRPGWKSRYQAYEVHRFLHELQPGLYQRQRALHEVRPGGWRTGCQDRQARCV